MKKRIISALVTLSLAIALIVVAIPKESTKEDLPLKAYNFFLEEGFSPEQATSIVALIKNSSNFDSSATANDENFYGLCQWGYARLDNLKAFANERGEDISSFETQLEFLASELSPDSENYQLVSYNGYEPSDWEKADNVEDSIEALMWTYYRPAKSTSIEKQVEWAKSFEEKVAQSQKDIPIFGVSFIISILYLSFLLLFYLVNFSQILLLSLPLLINKLQVP